MPLASAAGALGSNAAIFAARLSAGARVRAGVRRVTHEAYNLRPWTWLQAHVSISLGVRYASEDCVEHHISYTLNANDELISVDGQWDAFATANGGAHLTSPNVLGRSIWDFVSDPTTRLLYRDVLARVRHDRTVTFTFRCDAPDCRRLLAMTVLGKPGGWVVFEIRTISEERREPQRLLDLATLRSSDLLRLCGWCKKVDVSGRWTEVEEAVVALGLFDQAVLPQVTHGICETCYTSMAATAGGTGH